MDPVAIANLSLEAALLGENVQVDLPLNWERPHGFPFPTIRPRAAGPDGLATWEWQPCALILWVTKTQASARNGDPTP